MADIFSKEKRHEIMSRIGSKDTKIEIRVRHWLYHHGIRYRKNCRDIIGKPDIVIKKYKIALFVHGCFWHGHENCKTFRLPMSNISYWENKIENNRVRDKKIISELESMGWYAIVVWECALKSNFNETMDVVIKQILDIKKKTGCAT